MIRHKAPPKSHDGRVILLNMTEQVPEDLTEAEVADRREADRSEDEGDTVSEVDRWDDEGGHDRAG